MASTPLRIGHVVNPLTPPAGSDLAVAQPMTFESIRRAVDFSAGADVEIEIVAAVLPEDRDQVPAGITIGRPLERTVQDVAQFETSRPLPLLADVLERLCDAGPVDIGIYTNIDISLQPHFYEFVASAHRSGFDAFTINRRTVLPVREPLELTELYGATGAPHNGHDCFVFSMASLADFELDDVCIGAPPVGRLLLVNLLATARRFREFRDEHLTFHIGNERVWRRGGNQEYRKHNLAAGRRAVARLSERFPERNVESLDYVGRFIPADLLREDDGPLRPRVRPFRRREMIFSINPGLTGSRHLAHLLDTAPEVHADHMSDPPMTGEDLRLVMDGRRPSLGQRMHKGDALARRLEGLPLGSVLADTSDMFIKTWADVALWRFPESSMRVVVLRRDLIATVNRFREKGVFTSARADWSDRVYLPTARHSLVGQFLSLDQSDPYDLIVGYLLDIELRAQQWLADHPERTVEVWLEDLHDMDRVRRLFRSLAITAGEETERFVMRRQSAGDAGSVSPVGDSPAEIAERVSAVLERFEAGGGPIAEMSLFH